MMANVLNPADGQRNQLYTFFTIFSRIDKQSLHPPPILRLKSVTHQPENKNM